MTPYTKQSTGPSEMVLDPFIVFNRLHRAAGENCKKRRESSGMKGLYRGTNCLARVAVPTPPCSGPTIIHHSHILNLPFILPRTAKIVQLHRKIKSICLILAVLLIVERIQTLLISNIQNTSNCHHRDLESETS